MDLSIIIVSYNTQTLLEQCLISIINQAFEPSLEIIVIDNASTDGSAGLVKSKFPQVKLIQNPQNIGFGPANNQAALKAKGVNLLFLNSDCRLMPGSLVSFYQQFIEKKADLASCQLINPDKTLQPQGGALPNVGNTFMWQFFIDDLPPIRSIYPAYQERFPNFFKRDQTPGWVAGTAMMVKASLFHKLNGFNPDIFMYGEDVDLCYRAHLTKAKIRYFSSPQIVHHGHQSGSPANALKGEYQFIIYFFSRYQSTPVATLVRYCLKLGALLRLFIFGKILGQYAKAQSYREIYHLV